MKHMLMVAMCLAAPVVQAEAKWPAHGVFSVEEGRDANGDPICGLQGRVSIQERAFALTLEMRRSGAMRFVYANNDGRVFAADEATLLVGEQEVVSFIPVERRHQAGAVILTSALLSAPQTRDVLATIRKSAESAALLSLWTMPRAYQIPTAGLVQALDDLQACQTKMGR